jgi:hypothetical protein
MNPNKRINKDLVVENHQGLQNNTKQSLTLNESGSGVSITELAAYCVGEINHFRRGEPGTEKYSIELLRRATMLGEEEARTWAQQCLSELVVSCLSLHPNRGVASELGSEENYVAQTFERFWQTTALTQQIEFNSLADALEYLHACLNGVIVDTLRTYSRLQKKSVTDSSKPTELRIEGKCESKDVWGSLKKVIPNGNEVRLAYLLFHCGLKPRQIMNFCPQEFSDLHEIYRLRSNLMNHLV